MSTLVLHLNSRLRVPRRAIAATTLGACLFFLLKPTSIAQELNLGYVPDEVLVGVKAEMDDDREPERLAQVGSVLSYNREMHHYHLRIVPGISVEEATRELSDMAETAYAEPNWYVPLHSSPDDTYYATPATSGYSAQYGPQTIQVHLARAYRRARTSSSAS